MEQSTLNLSFPKVKLETQFDKMSVEQETWQKEQKPKQESTDNPLIKEAREILTTASIIEPVNFSRATQRLAVVAPVYREWNNGHIIDLLDSLAQQSVDKETFFAVLVINNVVEASAEAVAENQLTVDVVRYLTGQDEEIPEDPQISLAQREKLAEIRASGLNIVGIDLTKGIKKHMGLIRTIGSIYALERGLPSTENTYLSWMDADSQVESRYCDRLVNYLSQNTDINALYLPFTYYAEGDRKTFESSYLYRFDMTDRYFRTVLFPTTEKAIGGPLMVGKASVWSEIIEDFPPNSERDEDFIASKRLFASGKVDFYPDTVVSTADRAYEEGFDAKDRQEVMREDSARREWIGLDVMIFRQLVDSLGRRTPPDRDALTQICLFCNIPYQEETLNRLGLKYVGTHIVRGQQVDLLALKLIQNKYFAEIGIAIGHTPSEYAESVRQFIEANLSGTERDQVEETISQEIAREDEQARELRNGVTHIFQNTKLGDAAIRDIGDERIDKRIPWVREEALKFDGSDAEFIRYLEQISPDVFAEKSENAGVRKATATLRGIMFFLYRARASGSEKYPNTHRIWNILTESKIVPPSPHLR